MKSTATVITGYISAAISLAAIIGYFAILIDNNQSKESFYAFLMLFLPAICLGYYLYSTKFWSKEDGNISLLKRKVQEKELELKLKSLDKQDVEA